MQQIDLAELQQWFTDYVSSFCSKDADIQKHVLLKQEHTIKVIENTCELSGWLGLSARQQWLAKVIALFHDIGRFQQYAQYRTFIDHKSVDHAQLGLGIIAGLPQLACLSAKEREKFTFAIANHNRIELPAIADENERLFAAIIRDADKLDIYRVLSGNIPGPSKEGCSPVIIQDLLAGRQSSYTEVRTPDDPKLLRLSWVYDMNYRWTVAKVVQRGYLEPIIEQLPQTPEVREVVHRLKQYLAIRMKN